MNRLEAMPVDVRDHIQNCKSCKNDLEKITTEKAIEILKMTIEVRYFRNNVQKVSDGINFSGAKFGEWNFAALHRSREDFKRLPNLRNELHQKVEDVNALAPTIPSEDFGRCVKIAEHSIPYF